VINKNHAQLPRLLEGLIIDDRRRSVAAGVLAFLPFH
jgi:hypothetical protein